MTLQRQLITFLFVGGLNTLFGYSWYALFIFLGLPYLYASLLASSLSLLFNFKMTGTFVFGSKNNAGFLKFIGVFVIASTVSTLGVTFMTHVTSNLYLAGFVAIFPAAATSFTLNKFITFKSRAQRPPTSVQKNFVAFVGWSDSRYYLIQKA